MEKFLSNIKHHVGRAYTPMASIKKSATGYDCIGIVIEAILRSELNVTLNKMHFTTEAYKAKTLDEINILTSELENNGFKVLQSKSTSITTGDILLFHLVNQRLHFAVASHAENDEILIIHANSDAKKIVETNLDDHLKKYLINIIRFESLCKNILENEQPANT